MLEHIIQSYKKRINILSNLFEINIKKKQIQELECKISNLSFWNNKNTVEKTVVKLNNLKNIYKSWYNINNKIKDLIEFAKLITLENADEQLVTKEIKDINEELSKLEIKLKFTGQNDENNAFISINAGAGGKESCDWAQILSRMYLRWAENHNFKTKIVYILSGEEVGIKKITMLIRGQYSYGMLQSEIGIHRLIRVSPFDSNKRRHTSFCSVDVIPEVNDKIDIIINNKDIRIDTYRASGAGGQHVNTTDSAVRITHLKTGIIVQSQNERSQIKNRAIAIKLLKAKLYEFEYKKKCNLNKKHHSEKSLIEWGNQIRSYIFMPYHLVKDHRSNYESSKINLIINGDIDMFINSYLSWKIKN
ncbi:MAG: peptide chain release factor 2 [Endomicrobium sp.]|jgi:peptide chain release factor 2|nr:peptide chain release factor 2 [Endomicrobium sp.]